MRMSNKVKEIDRYSPGIKTGLTAEQVQSRLSQGLTNNIKAAVGKSYTEIIFTNVFSFFNILLFVIAGFMIAAKYYSGLFFLVVLIPNIIIGLYEDIKAKRLLSKLRLMTQPTVKALRGGAILQIGSKDIVLDDIYDCLGE